MTFDFAAFKRAYEGKDLAAWIGFYADDAEWIEYRAANPPRNPNVMRGRDAIAAFLTEVCASPISLAIEDAIVAGDGAAFRAWVSLPDGRRIVEHVMLVVSDNRIARQVDVEAWD